MRRLLLVNTALFFSLACFAQMPKEVPDAKAKAILDELSKKTKTYTTVKAEFEIITTGADGKVKDKTTGTMWHKGSKYKLEIKGQTIFCDGKTQWTYIKDDNEVQINDAPDPAKNDNINPSNIFTIYEKNFKYYFEKEEVQGGATIQIVKLIPLEPGKKPYHTVKLFIDKVKNQITSVKVMNKDGNTTTITVKSFTTNTEMPDAFFIFNKKDFPGVTETDLR